MRAKLVGGPFDGQEVETDEPTNVIRSDGGSYYVTDAEKMTSPDGLRVVGAAVPVFTFVPDDEVTS